MAFSKTQIDRLGDRLKKGPHTESDLRLLDDYRRSYGEAYEAVIQTIRQRGKAPTGRLAKSTISIVEKLRRESIRLSQIQDIAGCRVIVANIAEQEEFVASLVIDFPEATVTDRRDKPSHGYRAVHVIVEFSGRPVEIQVRTALQHLWAEVSEKSSDVLDPTIKYGGGSELWRDILTSSSESVATYERHEKELIQVAADWEVYLEALEKWKKATAELLQHQIPEHQVRELRAMLEAETGAMEHGEKEDQELRELTARHWNVIADLFGKAISWLDALKEQKQ